VRDRIFAFGEAGHKPRAKPAFQSVIPLAVLGA
jgi:hypothetical protein